MYTSNVLRGALRIFYKIDLLPIKKKKSIFVLRSSYGLQPLRAHIMHIMRIHVRHNQPLV